MKFLRETSMLVSAIELGQVLDTDSEVINNWIRRGIIRRTPIGGRKLRNRLFSPEEVYKAALTNELVRLGIPPSPASDAVNELWKEWDKRSPEGHLYAMLLPAATKWKVQLCLQLSSAGGLKKIESSETMELPKQAFAVLPISEVFEHVTMKLTQIFERSNK